MEIIQLKIIMAANIKDRIRGIFQLPKSHKLGTFGGVFTPDVLTILGVIMYLRLGWVVGNAGLLGAIDCFDLDITSIRFCFPTEQLFHVDGTPREDFVPEYFLNMPSQRLFVH